MVYGDTDTFDAKLEEKIKSVIHDERANRQALAAQNARRYYAKHHMRDWR